VGESSLYLNLITHRYVKPSHPGNQTPLTRHSDCYTPAAGADYVYFNVYRACKRRASCRAYWRVTVLTSVGVAETPLSMHSTRVKTIVSPRALETLFWLTLQACSTGRVFEYSAFRNSMFVCCRSCWHRLYILICCTLQAVYNPVFLFLLLGMIWRSLRPFLMFQIRHFDNICVLKYDLCSVR
jgi:hypothetical protein